MALCRRPPLGATITEVDASAGVGRLHRLRQCMSLARSLGSSLPSKAVFLRSRSFRERVLALLREGSFDLLLLNGADLLWLAPLLPGGTPVVLVAHNLEHELYESQIRALVGVPEAARGLLRVDCEKLRRYELSGMRRVRHVLFLSSTDAETIGVEIDSLHALVVPPLFEGASVGSERRRGQDGRLHVGFMGHFGWWPNQRSLDWLRRRVLPGVGRDLRLHLFGERSERETGGDARILGHGYVERLEDVWERCDFMLCPAQVGAGVQTKLAEAVHHRVPVLATPLAARGLPVLGQPSVVVRDGAREWTEFLDSPAATELGRRRVPAELARRFAVDEHVGRVQSFLREAVEERG